MAGGLASINILFRVDLKKFSTELQNSVRELKKTGEAMKEVGKSMSLYITAPVVAAGAASIKMASDFEESRNKVEVAFKDSASQVEAFAKSTLNNFGIAEGSALDMAALFGDMATSMGLPESMAAKMSTTLVGLAGDLASFKNIGLEQATTALNGVFTGETESLKMLGIVMTETNLAQFALSRGITKNIKDFSQAEKVQLRYAYVMEQTKNAQGDFARTGGGAANQVRIFQESLKELGAQFGQVILPAFASVVKAINGMISSFAGLDEGTRNTIVVTAGIAAAIGPVVYAVGSLITTFQNLRIAFEAVKVAMLANPFTALASVLATVVTVTVLATSRLTALTNANEEFSKTMASAAQNVAKEKSELEKNLAVAKNKAYSDEQRRQAVANINALSPELLGNIKLENIYTRETTEAVKGYNKALETKAKVMAAQEKLVEVQKKLLDLQLGQLDAVKPSLWQNFSNAVMSGGNSMAYAARNTETVVKNFVEEKSQLEKLQHALIGFIGDNETFTQSQNAAADATLNLANTIASGKVGTIDYYKKQITELEKLRDTTATSRSEVQVYDEKIADLKKSIDKLEGKRVVLEVISQKVDESIKQPELNLSANAQIKKDHEQIIDLYRQAQKAYVETDEEFKYLQQQIESREFAIKFTTNPTSLIQAGELIGGLQADVTHLTDGTIEMSAALQGVATGMGETFEALGNGITSAMGEATNGFDRFMKTLISGAVRLIAVFLSQSIAGAISGATQAAAQTGVAAPVTLPAFIAEMVGVVIGAFASIPKFETGGVVGGSSYYGDRILARLNSGELILNQRQQSNLWDMIQPAGSNVQVQIGGGFEIEGTKLRLVLDRTDKKQNRGG